MVEIWKKINECYQTAPPHLILGDTENVSIFMPKIVIDVLMDNYTNEFGNVIDSKKLRYRGFEILLGYELAIVIAHRDAPIHKNLIHKVYL